MRITTFVLSVLLGHRAAPQEIIPIFPIQNSTKPAPTETSRLCDSQCVVKYPQLSAVQWVPESHITYTENIVVATISIIITTSAESTWEPRTRTVYGYVPPEYSLYSLGTNEEGTAVVTVPIPQSDGRTFWSQFTYPTPYIDYFTEYHWQGVLQTYDRAFVPVCETATPEPVNIALKRHPEYPRWNEQISPGKSDPYGTESRPLWMPIKDEPDKLFFDAAFPSESAFSYCESIPASTSFPTQYAAAKFITEHTTVYTSPSTAGVVVIQPSATGWEETSKKCCVTPSGILSMSSGQGWDLTPLLSTSSTPVSSLVIHIKSTVLGLDPERPPPQAQQTSSPEGPGNNNPASIPDIIINIINNNPGFFSSGNPSVAPTRAIFTVVPTVINGQSTTIPAFILPDSSATASMGETVIINGQVTVLTPPPPFFTLVPTMINGVATAVPVYIINGTATATIGQTVIVDGKVTVLATPTGAERLNSGFGGPAVTIAGPQAPSDGTSQGSKAEVSTVQYSTIVVGLGALALIWL